MIQFVQHQRNCKKPIKLEFENIIQNGTRPAWAGFKTGEEGIAIIKSCIL